MNAILRTFFALAIIAFALPANAGPFEDGIAAVKRGEYATAIQLWRPIAEQGHAIAQVNLGFMYAKGQGVPQVDAEAVKWWRQAAEQGHIDAQTSLGLMYALGQGVPKDNVIAHMWLTLAAGRGDRSAREPRDLTASLMTSDQIAEAERMAREWMAKHQQ